MIIDFLTKHRHIVFKKYSFLKFLLVTFATFLFDFKTHKYSISSDNLLYENLIYSDKIVPQSFYDDFSIIKSPVRTILILISKKDIKYANLIYGSLKQLKPKLKEIIITYKKPLYSKYFIVINLNFKNKNFTKLYPLSNLQPNSDLLYISQYYFPVKLFLSKKEFLNFPDINYPNTININLNYSRKNIKLFLLYLKTLTFIDSFENGSYLYIPFSHSKIDIMQVLSFCICIFVLEILEWVTKFKTARIWIMCVNLILFFFAPWTCFLCLFFSEIRPFLMIFYFLMNFRYGTILFVVSYISNIYKLFLSNSLGKVKNILPNAI